MDDIDRLMRKSRLDEEDLIDFMTVYGYEEVENEEVEGEFLLLTRVSY